MTFSSAIKQFAADGIGITSSALCFVHCIATPFLLYSGVLIDELAWLKYVFMAVAFISILSAIKETTPFKTAALLWVSFWLFTFSLLFENRWELLEYTGLLASVGIITGHLYNIRSCSKCVQKEPDTPGKKNINPPLIKSNQEDEVIY
jgi:hypothetical protein